MDTCYDCQCPRQYLVVHHLNQHQEDNRDENLLRICPSCHKVRHSVLPSLCATPDPLSLHQEFQTWVKQKGVEYLQTEHTVLATTLSLRQALRHLDQIAASGRWVATHRRQHSLIYSKGEKEITILRKGTRAWSVIEYRKESGHVNSNEHEGSGKEKT